MMKILFVVIVFCAVLSWILFLSRRKVTYAKPRASGVIPSNSIFHKPGGADCPTGTTLLPKYFSEADGTTRDACHNPHGDGSIDYLNPGEGCSLGFELESPKQSEPRT